MEEPQDMPALGASLLDQPQAAQNSSSMSFSRPPASEDQIRYELFKDMADELDGLEEHVALQDKKVRTLYIGIAGLGAFVGIQFLGLSMAMKQMRNIGNGLQQVVEHLSSPQFAQGVQTVKTASAGGATAEEAMAAGDRVVTEDTTGPVAAPAEGPQSGASAAAAADLAALHDELGDLSAVDKGDVPGE